MPTGKVPLGILVFVPRTTSPPAPARTGWVIAALAAIPVLSVSAVALVSDIASGTDPARLWSGLVASAAGAVGGLLVVRLIRAVNAGLLSLSTAILRWFGSERSITVLGRAIGPARRPVLAPVTATAPGAVRRRGPPLVLR